MKISIGMNIQGGAWGGGNQFSLSLSEYLREKGWDVFFDLAEPDLDIIVLTEPRLILRSSAYDDQDIKYYRRFKNPRVLVVHRINECDARKGTNYVDKILLEANQCADHTVFISSFLSAKFLAAGIKSPSYSTILNGASGDLFYPTDRLKTLSIPAKVVTHHWGGHWLKGFDIYQKLDQMLSEEKWRQQLEFTYIGRVPKGFRFTYARHLQPLSGTALADELRRHHIYLTASQNEPAGMHHIEGAMCGLPVLYRSSGGLPDYCEGFGLSFYGDDFTEKLIGIMKSYDYWSERVSQYPFTAKRMSNEYMKLFTELVDRRAQIVSKREARPAIDIRRIGLNALFRRYRATVAALRSNFYR